MALGVCKLAYANVVFDLDGSTESEIWFQTSGYWKYIEFKQF